MCTQAADQLNMLLTGASPPVAPASVSRVFLATARRPAATVGAVEYDFDEDFAQTLGDGLDRALEKLTPEQRAKLPEMENLREVMTKAITTRATTGRRQPSSS